MSTICGIYKLSFTGTNMLYIGQSKHINKRYQHHLYLMKKGLASPKLQGAYYAFGKPSLEILIECEEYELDELETEAISVYDSVANGFNSLQSASDIPKPDNSGTNHGNCRYSEAQLLQVLAILAQCPELKFRQVSEITGVSYSTIGNIASGSGHTWLRDKDPDSYITMLARKGLRNSGRETNTLASMGKPLPIVISPDGTEYTISNLRRFAKEHGIPQTTLGNIVYERTLNSSSGWKLKRNNDNTKNT